MACFLELGKDQIYKFSNAVMERIYEKLIEIIINKKLGNNKILLNFVIQLDQDHFGLGGVSVSILNYFQNKHDLNLISNLFYEINKTLNYETLNKLINDINEMK